MRLLAIEQIDHPVYKYRAAADHQFVTQALEVLGHPHGFPMSGQVCGGFVTFTPDRIVVHRGYCWDGPSGPTIDTIGFMRGALVHDALYQCMREGAISPDLRGLADAIMMRENLACGMTRFRAFYTWAAVRLFAGRYARP